MGKLINLFFKIRAFVSGKKTHIFAALIIIKNIVSFLSGDISYMDFIHSPEINNILLGGVASSGRAAIKKIEKSS